MRKFPLNKTLHPETVIRFVNANYLSPTDIYGDIILNTPLAPRPLFGDVFISIDTEYLGSCQEHPRATHSSYLAEGIELHAHRHAQSDAEPRIATDSNTQMGKKLKVILKPQLRMRK
jgi:hypothetical protein